MELTTALQNFSLRMALN